MLTIAHVTTVMLVLPCWRILVQPFMELVCTRVNIRHWHSDQPFQSLFEHMERKPPLRTSLCDELTIIPESHGCRTISIGGLGFAWMP